MPRCLSLMSAVGLAAFLTAGAALAADDWNAAANAYRRGDYATVVRILRTLAQQGMVKAQAQLGYMYARGLGVPRNFVEAVKWYRLAAARGDAKSQYNLGVCHDLGQGVPRSITEAVKWFRLAADQGHPRAQYNLGVCYYKAEGVPRDVVAAYKWISLAARQGHPKAIALLPMLAQRLNPVQLAEAKRQAAAWRPKKTR
jgi:TPR repeat protein